MCEELPLLQWLCGAIFDRSGLRIASFEFYNSPCPVRTTKPSEGATLQFSNVQSSSFSRWTGLGVLGLDWECLGLGRSQESARSNGGIWAEVPPLGTLPNLIQPRVNPASCSPMRSLSPRVAANARVAHRAELIDIG